MSVKAMKWAWKAVPKGCNKSELLVLLCLADHANEKWESWPSRKTISELTHLSINTVDSALTFLKKSDLISAASRFRHNKSQTSNKFLLHGLGTRDPIPEGTLGPIPEGTPELSVELPKRTLSPTPFSKGEEKESLGNGKTTGTAYSKSRQAGVKLKPKKAFPQRRAGRVEVYRNGYTPAEKPQYRSPAEILGANTMAAQWLKAIQDPRPIGYQVRKLTEAAEALRDLQPDEPLLNLLWRDLKQRTAVWAKDMEPKFWPPLERYLRERMWEQPLPFNPDNVS